MLKNKHYYTLDNIKKKHCLYNVIFSGRSDGKSYAVIEQAASKWLKDRTSQLAVVRRFREDFKGKRGRTMMNNLLKNGYNENVIKKYSKGEYDNIVYFGGRWYMARYDEKLDKNIPAPTPFAISFAITEWEHDKSSSYPEVTDILLDEMITRGSYLPDEFVLFQQVCSTIIRDRDNVTIWMVGNTVNKYCPYFSEMGLTNVAKMKKGDIDVYQYGDSGLTVAVEWAEGASKYGGKKSDKYFAFNNPKLKMITNSDWEIPCYPRNKVKFEKSDIMLIYFIIWENVTLQCEIVSKDGALFTFIHQKTTLMQHEDRDIIFSKDQIQKPNYFINITRPTTKIMKRIYWFFQSDNVYYQDNEIGELVRNYLSWCKSDTMIR